jgi:DNA-binding CsgD family transcriptional regulator
LGEPALSPSIALRVLKHFQAGVVLDGAYGAIKTESPVSAVEQQAGDPSVHLSAREVEVLRLIAKGYTSPEVAQLLALSGHTVSSYVRDIYRKLGISSRAEATIEAVRRGLTG